MKQKIISYFLTTELLILLVFPASTNYQLKSFEFGGGGASMSSSTYSSDGIVGEVDGQQSSSTYKVNSGLVFVQNANVPTVTLVNSGNWYNKLHVTIGPQNNPTDTKYAIAISTDNFTTTQYVQSDDTVGSILGPEDYQTYSNWGGASGEDIIGLLQNTTYEVKVKAMQGYYTESAYGPPASNSTSPVTLTFDIDIAPTDTETSPPYSISMGSLNPGSVSTANDKIWVDLDTNAANGGYIYIYDQYAGLKSVNVDHTITSSSTNLSSATEGFGLQVDSATNISAVSPYNGSAGTDNVGVVDSTVRELFSANSPVTSGRGSVLVKAKASNTTPAANDYADTLTLISSAAF